MSKSIVVHLEQTWIQLISVIINFSKNDDVDILIYSTVGESGSRLFWIQDDEKHPILPGEVTAQETGKGTWEILGEKDSSIEEFLLEIKQLRNEDELVYRFID